MEKRNTLILVHFIGLLFPFHKRKSMFTVLHSDINSLKSGLLYLTVLPYCKKSRSAKVKDGIINFILRNYLIDRYKVWLRCSLSPTSMVNKPDIGEIVREKGTDKESKKIFSFRQTKTGNPYKRGRLFTVDLIVKDRLFCKFF